MVWPVILTDYTSLVMVYWQCGNQGHCGSVHWPEDIVVVWIEIRDTVAGLVHCKKYCYQLL